MAAGEHWINSSSNPGDAVDTLLFGVDGGNCSLCPSFLSEENQLFATQSCEHKSTTKNVNCKKKTVRDNILDSFQLRCCDYYFTIYRGAAVWLLGAKSKCSIPEIVVGTHEAKNWHRGQRKNLCYYYCSVVCLNTHPSSQGRRRMMMLPISHLSRHTFHTNINSQYRSQDYSTTTHFLHQKTTRSNNGDDAGVVWWWWAGCWPRTTIKIRPITSVTRMNWCVVSTSSNISNNLRITQFPIYHLPLSSFQLHAVYYNKENAHQAPGHSS